jgi:secreted trypsin-like serine protease
MVRTTKLYICIKKIFCVIVIIYIHIYIYTISCVLYIWNYFLMVSVIFSVSFGKRIKIIGGKDAEIKEFPHQVSLRYIDGNKHFCGGSIITNQHILTAAHCVKNLWPPYSNVKIHTGTSFSNSIIGCKYKILLVHIHPGYTGQNETSFHNDIAVITVCLII